MPTKRQDPSRKPLEGKIAVVAGATRGTGRGIATALGEAGATVYCTGRSIRGERSHYNRPETIDETAVMVTAAGGKGIAVRVDHTIEAEVRELFARVEREHGHLDILSDSVGGEDPRLGGWDSLWKLDLSTGPQALHGSLFSHLLTAKYAAALMIKKRRGLIVQVTEGDLLGGGGNAVTDLVKSGLKSLAVRLAWELKTHRIAVVAITPGFLRSEAMLEHFGVTAETWRTGAKKDPNFIASESPLFIGRAVAALAQDPKILDRTSQILSSWELSREFGFTDANGERPDWGRYSIEHVFPSLGWLRKGLEDQAAYLEQLVRRTKAYLGEPIPAAPVRARTPTKRPRAATATV
jgi:NAD(P)-dependent dehydrogenase (short-subunit alcohol dehydrogenase family)